MAMKRPLIAVSAILACLMFAWATGAGRPYPVNAGGVIDPTCTSSSPCIEYDNNSTGPGIRGISVAGNGLAGSTKNASTSAANGRAGLIGNDIGTGTFNSGVHGLSVNGNGVLGQSTSNKGVYGASTSYVGVYGTSDGDRGVVGTGALYGVQGFSGNGAGVFGQSTNGIGVQGLSSNGVGVNAIGGARIQFPALSVVGGSPSLSSGDLIDACPGETVNPCDYQHAVLQLDQNGTLLIAGNIHTSGSCHSGCATRSGEMVARVTSYTPSESLPTTEDFGEARLVDGQAYVQIKPDFANIIDQRTVYSVSITPEGNSNGLFVTQKTLTGFAVRENNGGRSTLAFEYRIVAKPFGSTAKRLPVVDVPLRRPIGARAWHPGGVVPVH